MWWKKYASSALVRRCRPESRRSRVRAVAGTVAVTTDCLANVVEGVLVVVPERRWSWHGDRIGERQSHGGGEVGTSSSDGLRATLS